MSERQPLLSNSQRSQLASAVPTKAEAFKVAEAVGALQAGKLPSQEQLSKLIKLALDSDTLKTGGGPNSRTARVGVEGQKVLEDTKAVLRALKTWGDEKNNDNLIQNFFYNAATADADFHVSTPDGPSRNELSKDAQRAISSFRSIASLIVTNPTFRQLGSDAVLVSRDFLADAAGTVAKNATAAAEGLRPTDKERKQGYDFAAAEAKGKKTAKGLQSGRIQGEIRESIWDEFERAKQYVDETIPEGDAVRDRVVERVQSVVTQAQENPEYRRSLDSLVGLFKKYVGKAKVALDETADSTQVTDEDARVEQAGRDLRAFVEKISDQSLDGVVTAAQEAADAIRDDDTLSAYITELENFFDRLLYQPGFVTSQRAQRKASSLYDDGQALLQSNEKWKGSASKLQKELESLVRGITHDKATLRLVDSVENLGSSIVSSGEVGLGALKVEGHGLYRDVIDVVIPRLLSLVHEIPVPRVEYKSEEVDLVIDDVRLVSASFIPDSVRVLQNNDLRFTQGYATYASEFDTSLRLRIQGVHFSAKDIAFWISKKSGLLPYEDAGLLDFTLGAKGASFDVTLENATEDDRETFFTVKNVDVSLSDFDFRVHDNEQWFATWFARPILRAFIKRNLSHALEAQVAEYLRGADFRAFALQQRIIAATNAKATAADYVSAIVRDSIFPHHADSGPTKIRQTGVVKYGRRGEYILHVGVDEEVSGPDIAALTDTYGQLFPNQPPARVSNKQRERAKAVSEQAREDADKLKKNAKDAQAKIGQEINELDARRKEEQRRESKTEGWRSDAFNA